MIDCTFPAALDSSMLAAAKACPQKWFREYGQHWKVSGNSVHLHAGGAYALALEKGRRAFYEEGLPQASAVDIALNVLTETYGDFDCPPQSAKSLDRMIGALKFYFENYPMDIDSAQPLVLADGRRAIEFTFAIPLPINHPDTGLPILYCGRADMIVTYAGGIYVLDDKTTSSLGSQWSKQWQLRSQFSGYIYAARHIGIDAIGAIVRGVSILKTKYETQQAITSRSPFLLDRWYQQTLGHVQRLVTYYQAYKQDGNIEHFPFSFDAACNEYGGCPFTRVCESPDPDPWLNSYFQKREWNPLEHLPKKPVIESD